jgi:hypothetical protein
MLKYLLTEAQISTMLANVSEENNACACLYLERDTDRQTDRESTPVREWAVKM